MPDAQPHDHEDGAATGQFRIHVGAAQADSFDTICRDLGVPYRLGGRIRVRDWRGNNPVRPGRTFVFERREDVERVLAWEQHLSAAGQSR